MGATVYDLGKARSDKYNDQIIQHADMFLAKVMDEKRVTISSDPLEKFRWGTKRSLEVCTTEGWFTDYEAKALYEHEGEPGKHKYTGNLIGLLMHPHEHKVIFKDGCSIETALNWLRISGFIRDVKGSKSSTKTGEWLYHNADRSVLQKVERHEDTEGNKRYPQYAWDAVNQTWSKNLDLWNSEQQAYVKIRQTLYHLPEIIDAMDTSKDGDAVRLSFDTLLIPEGEKCVDALVKLGHLATTTAPGGAPADWSDGYYASVVPPCKRVGILADNDEPGVALARRVAHALTLADIVPDIRILALPGLKEKEDVYDWIHKYGGTLDKLMELLEAAPQWDDSSYKEIVLVSATDHMLTASEFLKHCYTIGDKPILQHSKGDFYKWNGSCNCVLPSENLYAELHLWLSEAQYKTSDGYMQFLPTQHKVREVLKALTSIRQLNTDFQAPAWLPDIENQTAYPPNELIAFRNVLLHWPTMQMLPHTPMLFNVSLSSYLPILEWLSRAFLVDKIKHLSPASLAVGGSLAAADWYQALDSIH